jgi:hypothetical protein
LTVKRKHIITVTALVSAEMTFTRVAASLYGATRIKTRASKVKRGFPGGCGLPRMLEAPTNSPQSQKETVGAMVAR